MANLQHMTEEWLAANRHRMVNCQRQPGNLIISKQACRARMEKAMRENLDDTMQGDFFEYVHKKGLAICLGCASGSNGGRKTPTSAPIGH